MTPSNSLKGLFFPCVCLCLLFMIIYLSLDIITNINKAYAVNTRGTITYKEILDDQERYNYNSYLDCYNEYGNTFKVDIEDIEDCTTELSTLNKLVTYDNPIHSIRKANLSDNQIKLIEGREGSFVKIDNEVVYNYEEVYNDTIQKLDSINEMFSKDYISDREYIENVYSYLKDTIDYDYTYKNNNIYEATVNNSSACLGLSSMLKYLLDKNMIPNFIAEGYLEDQLHCWNEVYLEGEWYLLDLTSDSKDLQTLTEQNQIYNGAYKLSEITESLVGYYKIRL